MPKLIVFGDSFASSFTPGKGPTWMQALAENIGCQSELIFGKSGSSLNYSAHQLMHYLESPQYEADDIIVFVFTSRNRSRLINENFHPGWACENVRHASGDFREGHPAEHFYKKYSEYFRLELELTSAKDYEVERFKIAMTLKQLPNMTVVISAFDKVVDFRGKTFMLADTHNFVLLDAELANISDKEFVHGCDFQKFYNFFRGEIRNCHLSKTNNQVLADLLSACIHNKSRNYFDCTQFKQHFLGLGQEYETMYQEEMGAGWERYKTPSKPDGVYFGFRF
jgi:hypothetical protein